MEIPPGQKQFECEHCNTAILVPIDLPPTSGPCPGCQQITTSPPLEQAPAPVQAAPVQAAPVEQVAVSDAPAAAPDRLLEHEDDAKKEGEGRGAGMLWAIAALVFIGLLLGGLLLMKKSRSADAAAAAADATVSPGTGNGATDPTQNALVYDGVEDEARGVLKNFLTASTVEEKAKYVIGKDAILSEMKEFYRGRVVKEDELRADFFSEWAMEKSDTDRGIYLLEFDRPKQFKMSELFNPVVDLRTQLSLDAPDLQTRSKAYRGNFEMEAVRAMVLLKREGDELLIDWHTYVQTKDRLFRGFTEHPVAGREAVFRVSIGEHVSSIYEESAEVRNYRLVDPSHFVEDSAVVTVNRNSENGKLLEKFAWTGISGKSPSGTSATVILKWSNDPTPKLQLSKILCWEFLGVGGEPSNLASSN